jgi:hypothetical protein
VGVIWLTTAVAATEIIKSAQKIRFMLALTCAGSAFPKPQLVWMQSRGGKGAFILPRALVRGEKTLAASRTLKQPEGQALVGIDDC